MERVANRLFVLMAAIVACAAMQAPAHALEPKSPACILSTSAPLSSAEVAQPGPHQTCTGRDLAPGEAQSIVRFDLEPGAEAPRYLRTRIGLFEQITLAVVDGDGAVRTRSYGPEDVTLISGEPMMLLELPEPGTQSRALFMIADQPRHDATLLRAELFDHNPADTASHGRWMLVLAVLLGMMLVPLFFDIAFWTALRSPFLLWHGALSLSFGALVFFRSGLAVEFFDLTIEAWRAALILSLGVGAAMALMFAHGFIEQGKLHPLMRRALPVCAIWALAISLVHAAGFEALHRFGGAFHSYGLAPVLLLFVAVMVDAYRRGSRAIRFQIVGWFPLLLAFAVQLVSYIVPLGLPTDALPLFYVGVLSETTVTAIGVADRFIKLRHERDRALRKADVLGTLTHKDPLTGLMNRRGLKTRFEELRAKGFSTFALLDLDRFKQVNDRFGHAVGDEVLKVAAEALKAEPGRNVVAVRLGGEEFLLLLRGADSVARAEALRTGMTLRIANAVEGLELPVTASMGVVVAPQGAPVPMSLDELYARADKLLYEAKADGRNRTVHERLILFERRKAVA